MNVRHVLVLSLLLSAAVWPAWAHEACTDSVYAGVDGSTIRVFHDGATYNCCPVFDYEMEMGTDRIVVREIEVESWCNCICCMDLDVSLVDVPPGEYLVEFHWFDCETAAWLVWELDVSVGDAGQDGNPPAVGAFEKSDCYGPLAGVAQDSPETWTTMKFLYR